MAKNKLIRLSDEDQAMLKIIMDRHAESKDESKAIRYGLASFVGRLLKEEYEDSVLKNEMDFDEFVSYMIYKNQKEI